MSKITEWRPRLYADVSEETYKTIRGVVPMGMQKQILGFLMEDLAEKLKEDPARILTAILLRELGVMGVLKLKVEILEESEDE